MSPFCAGIIDTLLTRVTSHVLRHSYATHAHEMGVPVRVLMQLLGHTLIETTEIYLHADKNGSTAVKSPLEDVLTRHLSQPVPTLRIFAG